MPSSDKKKTGRVWLVGAGPGDPGLITVRGLELLRRADVVVFDALANPALLAEAPPSAERIDVGKRAGEHKLTQDQTNQLLVDLAREGREVVRLKGGDPYLFGRGAEELAFLAAHGVEGGVVSGVTSGIAAPAAAGIPVTHRRCASSVTFVTGHEDPGKSETSLDFVALGGLLRAGGTVCIYMGASRLGAIARKFMAAGVEGSTPAAVVQWGTLPRQRSVRATLATAAQAVAEAGIGAPAIIVVGQVAAIDEPGLDYFTRRPLFGQRVLVTRTRQQASELSHLLREQGAEVIEAPTIELSGPGDWTNVDAAIRAVREYDWLVLTSGHGVAALAERLGAMGLDARHLAGVKVAVIGEATAEALWEHLRLRADLMPARFVAEALVEELIAKHGVAGRKLLLLRADIARPALPRLLTEAGALVTELVVYETRQPASLPEEAMTALREGRIDWVTFTSSSTATHLAAMLGEAKSLLAGVKAASIGAITSQTLRDLGVTPAAEAEVSDIPGLVEAMVKAVAPRT